MKASWCKYRLDFKFTAITSRERMNYKDTYYIRIADSADKHVFGLGEAGLFRGLSCDDRPDFETVLAEVCREIDRYAADPAQLADFRFNPFRCGDSDPRSRQRRPTHHFSLPMDTGEKLADNQRPCLDGKCRRDAPTD